MAATNLFEQQKKNLRRTSEILVGFVAFLAFLGIGADFFLYASGAGPGFPIATVGALLFGAGSSLWALKAGQRGPDRPRRPAPAGPRQRGGRNGDRGRPPQTRGLRDPGLRSQRVRHRQRTGEVVDRRHVRTARLSEPRRAPGGRVARDGARPELRRSADDRRGSARRIRPPDFRLGKARVRLGRAAPLEPGRGRRHLPSGVLRALDRLPRSRSPDRAARRDGRLPRAGVPRRRLRLGTDAQSAGAGVCARKDRRGRRPDAFDQAGRRASLHRRPAGPGRQ